MKRRCGWLPKAAQTPRRVVWARPGVATEVCPKSYITGESAAWLESFYAWKKLGGGNVERLGAREADAFLILEQVLAEAHAEQR